MRLGGAELYLVHATSVFAQACAMRGKRALLFVQQWTTAQAHQA